VHILHVIAGLSPDLGGPPEGLRQLAKAYPQIGDSVEVVCLDPPDAPYLRDMPCPVHALGQSWLGRYGLSPKLVKWLSSNISRFDGVVIQGIWTFPGIAVRRAAQKAGKPYFNFIHGALDPWFEKRYPVKHLKKSIYWPIQYPVLRDALAVLFTTESERELARISFRPNRWNGVHVPYGISDPEGDPAGQLAAFREAFPQLRDRQFLLFMSRLHSKKGCDLLIDAFATIASQYPGIDLVVAGPDQEGDQRKFQQQAAEHGIAHRVHWPGMIRGDLKWGALRAADAFILPSHTENFGIVVAESLAAGRPVLTTNKVNIWRQIAECRAGLIEDDTLEGTERLLRGWLEMSDEQREAMAARARPCFAAHFTMRRAAEKINEMFSATLPRVRAESAQTFRSA
jgi:glycosyltransferase involved in cell wall biosynthesis